MARHPDPAHARPHASRLSQYATDGRHLLLTTAPLPVGPDGLPQGQEEVTLDRARYQVPDPTLTCSHLD